MGRLAVTWGGDDTRRRMPSSGRQKASSESSSTRSGSTLALEGGALDFAQVEQVARQARPVVVGEGARDRLTRSRTTLEAAIAGGQALYGVNTGFGSLSRQRIPEKDLAEVQHNLLRSHAAGIGESLPRDVVRAMLLLLAASLSRGHSGVRPEVVDRVVALLNAGITPVVPEVGSVGASGDLAPLAHAALVLIGEGFAYVGDKREPMPGAEALRSAGLGPLVLAAKEGLALINGTHLMAARGALILADVERVFDAALVAAAMSLDAARGTDAALDERAHAIRRQPGQMRVAARLRSMLASSEIVRSHVQNDPRVQDPYSFRCAPQVMGAALDAIEYVRGAVQYELDAVTDNPLVFETDDPNVRSVVSAGNFHGLPLALPMDTLAIALVPLAGMAERRVFNLLAASDPETHLRPHLSPSPGLHSGLMITQYTAAACVNEMIGLSMPASVSNISTCAGMEDYNSFGPRSVAKARRCIELCARVVAIEMLCAAEGIEYHRPLKSGDVVERAHGLIRSVAPRLVADRPPSPDIEAVARLIFQGRFGE